VQDQEDATHFALWSFTPPGHPAHPAMVERIFYQQDGKVWMNMQVQCGGSKRTCDNLVRQFEGLNDDITRAAREHARQVAQPGAAAAAIVDARAVDTGVPPPPAPPVQPPPSPPPPSPPPPATPSVAPSAAGERWTSALARQCPGHHVEWLGARRYAPLLAGFESTLPAAVRNRADRLDVAQRLDAYQQLGLLHRFVLYSCAQVQCEAPSACSRGPK
jgi:hypothetical protein